MKPTFLRIAAAAFLAGGMAFAQTAPGTAAKPGTSAKPVAPGSHARRARIHQQMMEELNLTEAQKTQARTIFRNAWQNSKPIFDQLRQNNRSLAAAVKNDDASQIQKLAAEQGDLRGKLLANHELAMAQFYKILTPAQRAKADQMQQRAQTRMEQRFQQMQQEHQNLGE
jgi:Spy/CpxP family protein refolding chaperone